MLVSSRCAGRGEALGCEQGAVRWIHFSGLASLSRKGTRGKLDLIRTDLDFGRTPVRIARDSTDPEKILRIVRTPAKPTNALAQEILRREFLNE